MKDKTDFECNLKTFLIASGEQASYANSWFQRDHSGEYNTAMGWGAWMGYQAAIESKEKESYRLEAKIQNLQAGIDAVRELINNSDGVAGLHLNGDVATWEELGFTWLVDFIAAEDSL